jgi:hypothetical protein
MRVMPIWRRDLRLAGRDLNDFMCSSFNSLRTHRTVCAKISWRRDRVSLAVRK